MDYHKEFIVDFAKRTKANLKFIETAERDGKSVFEVTQFANSLLGLLVFPREEYMDKLPKTPLSELVEQGWPKIEATGTDTSVVHLQKLMGVLRHSIAHCNIEFIPGQENQIEGVKLWNKNWDKKSQKPLTWETKLSLNDLRTIVFKFIEVIERLSNETNSESVTS